MKKIILSTFLAVSCLFSSLSALTWSGIIDNNSKLSANNDFSQLGLKQSNGVYLSLASNLNEAGNLRFVAEGLYKYSLNCVFPAGSVSFTNILDVDLLKFAGNWTIGDGLFALSLGRFQYSDFSGFVFSQVSDGAYLSYDTLKTKTAIYAGYTGLLNRLNVSMAENMYGPGDQLYALCPKYVPVAADFTYKALFGSNTLGFQALCFIPVTEENTMKFYGTLVANGYFGTLASYDIRVTLGTEKFESLMLDVKLDTNFFVNSNLAVLAGAEYASGNQGSIKPFLTLSTYTFGNSPIRNGAIVPKVGLVFAANKIYAGLTERVILSMPADQIAFNGLDTSVNVLYNLFSDVQLGLDIGAYICIESKDLSNYFATLKASLAF